MRKTLILLLLVALGLSACTLPASPSAVPTMKPIATQVVEKLTQSPTNSTSLTAIATATKPAGPTATKPASPSATAAPSATTEPTKAAPSATAAAAATTQAPSATATATPDPGDPKTALGAPTLRETFQKPTSWGLAAPYDDGHTRVSMTTGKIILTSLEGNNWHGWRMYNAKIQNFYLEVVFQTLTCAGADQYGLVFRSPDSNKGLWFGVTCDGKYTLESGDIYDLAEIIKAKANPLIKSGSNQVNRLGVMAKGNKIGLYANGKLLEEITTDAYNTTGVFGYYIAGAKTVNFTYESTELTYWKLP